MNKEEELMIIKSDLYDLLDQIKEDICSLDQLVRYDVADHLQYYGERIVSILEDSAIYGG